MATNNKKVYLMDDNEVIRSSLNPEVRMKGKNRYKKKAKKKAQMDVMENSGY